MEDFKTIMEIIKMACQRLEAIITKAKEEVEDYKWDCRVSFTILGIDK